MVRFIIYKKMNNKNLFILFTFHYGQIYYRYIDACETYLNRFTFHYGQIYYCSRSYICLVYITVYIPLWLDLLSYILVDNIKSPLGLHSTMVRFIIYFSARFLKSNQRFTFHYGQIYYEKQKLDIKYGNHVYIPLWLDLLLSMLKGIFANTEGLHSTMVRFIMQIWTSTLSCDSFVYIPLWLDLLYNHFNFIKEDKKSLHSTMVRFIIDTDCQQALNYKKFTFHYGQIYYLF